VRELKNYVQRAYIMSDQVIEPDLVTANFVEPDNAEVLTVRIGTPLEDIERRVTFATLASCGNVKRRAAEILGISLKTLYNRLEAYAKSGATVPGVTPASAAAGAHGTNQETASAALSPNSYSASRRFLGHLSGLGAWLIDPDFRLSGASGASFFFFCCTRPAGYLGTPIALPDRLPGHGRQLTPAARLPPSPLD